MTLATNSSKLFRFTFSYNQLKTPRLFSTCTGVGGTQKWRFSWTAWKGSAWWRFEACCVLCGFDWASIFKQIIFTSTLVPLKIQHLLKEEIMTKHYSGQSALSTMMFRGIILWKLPFWVRTHKGVRYLRQAVKAIDASSLSSMKTRKASQTAKHSMYEDISQRLHYADQVGNHLISIGVRLLSFREGCSRVFGTSLWFVWRPLSRNVWKRIKINRQTEIFTLAVHLQIRVPQSTIRTCSWKHSWSMQHKDDEAVFW